MSIKIRNIGRWQQLPAGQAISLGATSLRNVKLELNVDMPTRLDVVQGGKPTFLTLLEPARCPATIEFVVDGACDVVPTTEGEVWWFTDDGTRIDHAVTTQSFTSLEQRMERTPELEITMLKAQLRREQRMAEQARLLLAAQEREVPHDPETGEVLDEQAEDGVGPDNGSDGEEEAGSAPAPEPEPPGPVADAGKPAAARASGPGVAA